MTEIEKTILEEVQKLNQRLAVLERLLGTKLNQEQARKVLGVSRHTIIRYRESGLLKPRKDGNRLYYNITDLNKLLC